MDEIDLQDFKKKFTPREHEEQVQVIQWARLNEGLCPELHWLHAIPNGAKLPYSKGPNGKKTRSRQGQILKSEGLKTGVPDLCLPVPRKGKHGAYCEMKRINGDGPTEEQRKWLEYLGSAGYHVACMYGAEQTIRFFADYLGLEVDPRFFNGYEPDYE